MSELAISIKKACHQDWDKMDSAEKGRFCSSCDKVVLDATLLSDQELLSAYSANNNTLCIRIPSNRLSSQRNNTARFSRLKYAIAACIALWIGIKSTFAKLTLHQNHSLSANQISSNILDTVIVRGSVRDSTAPNINIS